MSNPAGSDSIFQFVAKPAASVEEKRHSALDLYVLNPFPTEEWSYWINERLVGVGYVDTLPEGLSAIYFFHDSDHRRRSLGTFHI